MSVPLHAGGGEGRGGDGCARGVARENADTHTRLARKKKRRVPTRHSPLNFASFGHRTDEEVRLRHLELRLNMLQVCATRSTSPGC